MGERLDRPVTLARRQELSPTCFALELATEEPIHARPGQFAMVGLVGGYDPLLRRPFSVAGVRQEGGRFLVELLVKEVGKTTSLLRRLPVGSSLRLLAPLGEGFHLERCGPRPALVAGGIGLPPVLFAAQVLACRGVAFDFFFGAATQEELLLRERLAALTTGELVLCTDDGSFGEPGFVTEALRRRGEQGYSRLFACGPTPMLRAVARLARSLEVPAELSLEEPMACGVGVCLGCVVRLADGSYVPSCKQGPVFPVEALGEGW